MPVALSMKKHLLTLILIGIIAGAFPRYGIEAQSICGCRPDECCNPWSYCGTTDEYCGDGCQWGPCYQSPELNDVSVSDVVTLEFFDGIISQADASCAGKNFYSRAAFLEALSSYNQFGRIGSTNDSMREIAAFFGHVTHETGHFCYLEEIDGPSKNYCDDRFEEYPCNLNKSYHGRGPLQLSWNLNYGASGNNIGFDGLNFPETVINDPVISFKTALWYWMNYAHPYMDLGFGVTIASMKGGHECFDENPEAVQKRVEYYTEYCKQLGVDPGDDLTC
ncbi:hypothetical protein I3760_01G167900 [Carya illinoinensis]|nr:hypothetical protein I3760_01G167900 [Carya illinoinensis]